MVITKEVAMRWNSRNKKYYVDRGYQFTKMGESFQVKVEDIPQKYHPVKILVRCDECGTERWTYPYSDKLVYGGLCLNCALRHSTGNRLKSRINNVGSFYDACIEIMSDEEFWDHWSTSNKISPFELCRASHKKVKMKCTKCDYHGDYIVTCADFIRGNRCSYCGNSEVHPLDSFGYIMMQQTNYDTVIKRWSSKNSKSPFESPPMANKKVWFTCPCGLHEDYAQELSTATKFGYRCPECTRERSISFLQEKVENHIENKYGFSILHEQHCNIAAINPYTNYKLRYDLEVPYLKLIIEVNGEQHYKPSAFAYWNAVKNGTTKEDVLESQIFRDQIKKKYAIDMGYNYLVIPYTSERNNSYIKIIDNVFGDILKGEVNV